MLLRGIVFLAAIGGVVPPAQDDLVIRTTTRLVEVRVVAEGDHGVPVADLSRSDFQILDNNVPQTIRLFAAYRSASAAAAVPSTGTEETPAWSPTPSGYAVILLDWMNTGYALRVMVQDAVLKLLKNYEPRQRVAIFVLSRDNPRLLCDFTYDRELLAELVRRLSLDPEDTDHGGDVAATLSHPLAPASESGRGGGRSGGNTAAREMAILEARHRTTQTAVTFEKVADHLQHVPGRKTLLWVTTGIPMTIDGIYYAPYLESALGRLNRSDTAIYSVDAAGLDPFHQPSDSLFEFARRTGGVTLYNRNDLDEAMRIALEDMQVSYTLGFYAGEDLKPGLHAIDVKVDRPRIRLRYRESYDPSAGVR